MLIWVLLLAAMAWTSGCGAEGDEHDEHGDHDAEGEGEHGEHDGEDGDEHGEGVVQLSAAAIERAGVRVEEATSMAFGGAVRVPAEVQSDPDRIVHVAPLVEGQVSEVRVSVGQRVNEGDVLAVLRSVTLGETRASLAEAQAQLSVAQANYDRQQELVEQGIGAQRALVEADGALRTARARVSGLRNRTRVYGRGGSGATTLLRSGIAGEVVQRHATVGEVVGPDRTLFVVADNSRVWIVGSVYPQDIGAVSTGAEVTFVVSDLPDQSWQGPLTWVSPMMDEETRTLPIRLELDNEDGALRPGLFGLIRVPRTGQDLVVTVAATSVQEVDGSSVVFIPGHEPGEFEVHPVTVGGRDAGRVAIVEGLEPGDEYVAEGAFVLKSQLLRGELGEGHAH
ncbi:MAG TPA: hypothetical protein DEF51_43655 [Myxococcales bacterium]|nr:hypothetical protein [Myxococcales bacterium]